MADLENIYQQIPLEEIFNYYYDKTKDLTKPFSIAELKITNDDFARIKKWFENLSVEAKSWMKSEDSIIQVDNSSFSLKGMFGFLIVVLSSEVCRDNGTEESLWPAVCNIISDDVGLRSNLFPGGQPSTDLKKSIAESVKKIGLRNVIEFEGTQEYFDTVKLQFGFTFNGSKKRLAYWLVGLGVPFAVRVLLGDDQYPRLESNTFKFIWSSLKKYSRNKLTAKELREIAITSNWVKENWIDDLLIQAKKPIDLKSGVKNKLFYDDYINNISLVFDKGQKPRICITIDKDTVSRNMSDASLSRIAFEIDGKVVERWIRQSDGVWQGTEKIYCEPDKFKTHPNLSPNVLRIRADDGLLYELDLEEVGLLDEVILFDGSTNEIKYNNEVLNKTKDYTLLCDEDLEIRNDSIECLNVSGRKIFIISSNTFKEIALYLDDLIFWKPTFVESNRTALKISIENNVGEVPEIGSETDLKITGIPDETIKAELLIGSKSHTLTKFEESWKTDNKVSLTCTLLLKQLRVRIKFSNLDGKRILAPVQIKLQVKGIAVRGKESDGETSWQELRDMECLNIANGDTKCRLFLNGNDHGVVYEGARPLGRITRNTLKCSDLSGWGSPLIYKGETTYVINKTILDRGILKFCWLKSFGGQRAHIQLQIPIDDINDYSLICIEKEFRNGITVNEGIFGEKLDDYRWEIKNINNPIALAISYRGSRLGTYIKDEELSKAYLPNKEQFAILRWLKTPILSEIYSYDFFNSVDRRPLDFISSWYFGEGLPSGFTFSEVNSGIGRETALRKYLWGWVPQESATKRIIDMFCVTQDQIGLCDGLKKLGLLNPLLMARVLMKIQKRQKLLDITIRKLLMLPSFASEEEISKETYFKLRNTSNVFRIDPKSIDACIKSLKDFVFNKKVIVDEHTKLLDSILETDNGRRLMSVKLLKHEFKNV